MPRAEAGPGPSASSSFSQRRSTTPRVPFTTAPTAQSDQDVGVDVSMLNRKQPPSCDACRTRKLKCSGRPVVIELGPASSAIVPCDHCREWSLDCSYLYQRKRRGRKNRVVERLVDEQRARRASYGTNPGRRNGEQERDGSGESQESEDEGKVEGTTGRRDDAVSYGDVQADYGSNPIETTPNITQTWPPPPPPPSHPTHSQFTRSYHASPPQPQRLSDPVPPLGPSPNSSHFFNPSGPLSGGTTAGATIGGPTSTSPQGNGVSPSIALSEASVPANANVDLILSRDLAMHIIELYFEHVHCIIPVIHRPSFMMDLRAHEEEKRPMFFALIMATIAMTLIHIPRRFFPTLSHDGVRQLSDHCLKACYAIVRREMDDVNVDLICIKYFVFVIHNKHGNIGLEASAFGEAQYLAISMGLHREDMYGGLNPIEAERRRRIWFLIYNADKFEAVSRAKPVLLRSDEFMGPEATELPAEIDDKSITIHGYMPSSSPVPLISGFNILTRIVSVLGDLLVHERDIRRRPPKDPEDLLTALREVRKLQGRVKSITEKLPRPFQLDAVNTDVLPTPGWEEVMRDQLDLFFQDPMASETAKDGYLVLRANIHVTLAMTRLRLILHREDLINRSGQPGTPARNAAELVAADLGESVDWRHGVYQDLFKAVHDIPIQALAANGPSLVTKIRVVAVTLLDALPASEYGDANVQGIAAYLLDFLNIMTSIESQFAD